MSSAAPRALVLLRVPRGDPRPSQEQVHSKLAADRKRLGVPDRRDGAFELAGPYAIELDGRSLDEYVAWEF